MKTPGAYATGLTESLVRDTISAVGVIAKRRHRVPRYLRGGLPKPSGNPGFCVIRSQLT